MIINGRNLACLPVGRQHAGDVPTKKEEITTQHELTIQKNYRLIMNKKHILMLLLFVIICIPSALKAQNEEGERIMYYQMEPLNDSLFVKIQTEVFIDPPDPKAEIIVDLRDPNNQTVSIRGTLYPFLAFTPETRAKIITYPFKINLEELINYGSVFTRVASKIRINKPFHPPTLLQISSTMSYINPFFQLFGGERFGLPLKNDIGISVGIGTPYSGPFETNFVEANFHILGFRIGAFSSVDGLTDINKSDKTNNLYVAGTGLQIGYVVPLGDFFEVSYQRVGNDPTFSQIFHYKYISGDTANTHIKILRDTYLSWELRYPIGLLGSTRAKFYLARYLNEWHIGFTGRELTLGGSTFDFSFDAMPHSDIREPEYSMNILAEKVGNFWAASAFAVGPSVIVSKKADGKLGITTLIFNIRIKLGTSL